MMMEEGGSWQLFEMSYAAVQTQQNKVRKNFFLLLPVAFNEDLFEGRKLEVKRCCICLYYIEICWVHNLGEKPGEIN